MAHVQDVAAYILEERGPMTAMKLQKLCYYSYGYHLAWEERRLFPEHFEAWANGPVCPALYSKHRGQFEVTAGDVAGDLAGMDDGERESVNLVLNAYGDFTAYQLSQLTHDEAPWKNARARVGARAAERSTARLTDSDIMVHFEALVAANADGEE